MSRFSKYFLMKENDVIDYVLEKLRTMAGTKRPCAQRK